MRPKVADLFAHAGAMTAVALFRLSPLTGHHTRTVSFVPGISYPAHDA